MKKSFLSALFSGAMALTVLAGCTPATSGTTAAGTTAGTKAVTTAAATSASTTAAATTAAATSASTTAAATTTAGVPTGAVPEKQVYVSPQWVQSVIDGKQKESANYVIWEVAWGEVKDSPTYASGHLKGAVHLNTDLIEEPEDWNIRKASEIEAMMKDYGVTQDTTVIVYSDKGNNSADDRVAFAMLWAGVKNVKALDGGLDAWTKAGLELETKANKPVAAKAAFGTTVPAHPEYILTWKQVLEKQKDKNFKLVSIRSWDEFMGKTSGYSYIPKAGEPKGAIWGHDTDDGSYNKADGTVVNSDVLEGFLKESDASLKNELSFYCGTGWRAAMPFLIAYEEGYTNISMYDGGWFVWQKQDDLDVQVGDPNSADVKYVKVKDLSPDKAKK